MENNLILLTQNILNQYSYFAKEDSPFYGIIHDINECFLTQDNNYWLKILESTLLDEHILLKPAIEVYINSDFSESSALTVKKQLLKINSNIPKLENSILTIESNSPLSLFKLAILNKNLIKENFLELESVEELIVDYKNKNLPLSSFVAQFNYHVQAGILGRFDDNKLQIHVNGEKLSKSIFSHEYFHALDFSVLSKIYHNLSVIPEDLFLSHIDLSKQNLNLKEKSLIQQLTSIHQDNIHQYINDSYLSDLKLYFKYYFNYDIKPNQIKFGSFDIIDLMDKLVPSEKIPPTKEIVINGKTEYLSRYSEKDDLIKILEKSLIEIPNQSLYSLFSQIRNLTSEINYDYFSLPSEKLARIYQTQFEPLDSEMCEKGYQASKRVIPLGHERQTLTSRLNYLVEQEFMPYLQENIQNNISTKSKNSFFFNPEKIYLHRHTINNNQLAISNKIK